jgi:hypothetical protein
MLIIAALERHHEVTRPGSARLKNYGVTALEGVESRLQVLATIYPNHAPLDRRHLSINSESGKFGDPIRYGELGG